MTDTDALSRPRLERMHNVMAGHVASGDIPGLVTLVSRRGEIHVDAIGKMAIGGAPMQRDSIFRICSMTKPATRGKFHRHPVDPTDDGFTATATCDDRFLDLGLSGDR